MIDGSELDYLIEKIKKHPQTTFLGAFDPCESNDAWVFYLFAIAQQCGTGFSSTETTISCSNLWKVYYRSWNSSERELFRSISFTEFVNNFRKPTDNWRISDAQLYTRYLIHCEISEAYDIFQRHLLSSEHLDELNSYSADPFKKKLNLLKNILYTRPEHWLTTEGGPVVDYHIMRVFNRLNMDRFNSDLQDEARLRSFAYASVMRIKEKSGLTYSKIDSYLWRLGKSICTYSSPKCQQCPLAMMCTKDTTKVEPRVETFFY